MFTREEQNEMVEDYMEGVERFNKRMYEDMTNRFAVKDSGARQEFASGMVRDTQEGKLRPELMRDGPMFLRWAAQLTKGAVKYKPRNWMQASGQEELDRFLESADRHFNIWITYRLYGINIEDPENPTFEPLKEDHAAAVFFNINGVEYVKQKMEEAA